MSHPTVGIVIPTHNRPDFVVEAVASVLAHDVVAERVIVVDDGSSVPQREELVQLARKGKIELLHAPTRGVCAARNYGAAAAGTDLLLFLDDDDRLLPGAIASLRAALVAEPTAVAAAGGGQRHFIRDEYEYRGEIEWPGADRITFEQLVGGNSIMIGAMMMRRIAFDAAGQFDTQLPLIEDWDLWLRLSRLGPIVLPKVVALEYRIHPGNMSASSKVASLTANMVDHYLRNFSAPERQRYGPALVRYLVATYGSSVAWHVRVALRRGKLRDAARDTALLYRLIRLGRRFPEGRTALRQAWQEHRMAG